MTEESNSLQQITHIVPKYQTYEVNQHLDKGWKLIAIATGQHHDTKEPYTVYTLGWPFNEKPAFPDPNDPSNPY